MLNADGEWNDSRESLFSELIIQYGKLLDKPEYIERGYERPDQLFGQLGAVIRIREQVEE